MKKKIYTWLFGEYNPQEDTKYLVAFLLTVLFIAFMVFWFFHTKEFRRECAIEREMTCGFVTREVAEKIVDNSWFYF